MAAVTNSGETNYEAGQVPWVEKYRPQTLEDVSHQTEVVSTLKNAVSTGRLPHLLFYGPPGSGKTSVALALCKELWHPTQWKRRVLELNASDERGISVVREKIKQFASLSVGMRGSYNVSLSENKSTSDGQRFSKSYPNPPFKVIILDECDSITHEAQSALRRIIEAHSRITRFILICNYVTRIIEPLASRCAKFRFHSLPIATMKERVTAIAKAESIKNQTVVEENQIDAVLAASGGDMRRAVCSLQSVQALLAGQRPEDRISIDEDTINELAGLPPGNVIDSLYDAMKSKKFDMVQTAVQNTIADGYSVQVLLHNLLDKLVHSDDLDESGRALLAIRIAEAEDRLNDGADEYLQLMTVCGLALQSF